MHHGKNMRRGKMIAQGAHAATMCFIELLLTSKSELSDELWLERASEVADWVNSGMAKICLYVKTDEELLDLWQKANDAGLEAHQIVDSGHTEFGMVPTLTCIAIGPNLSEEIDKITGHLPLL